MQNYYKFKPVLKTPIWGTERWQLSGVTGFETMVIAQHSGQKEQSQSEIQDRLITEMACLTGLSIPVKQQDGKGQEEDGYV